MPLVEDVKLTEQRIKFAEVDFPPHLSPLCRSFIQQVGGCRWVVGGLVLLGAPLRSTAQRNTAQHNVAAMYPGALSPTGRPCRP